MKRSQNNVREVIINAARGIFSRFGFKKTTMDEIAQAAYKAKSSIYHYFENKEEIFKSVVEKEGAVLKEEIMNAINRENTPQKKLRTYVLTRMYILNRLVNFHQVIKEEYVEYYSFIEKLREKHYKDEIRMIEKILKEGREGDVFLIKNIEFTAQAILTALKGFEYPLAMETDVSEIEEKLDNLLEVLFYGILKR